MHDFFVFEIECDIASVIFGLDWINFYCLSVRFYRAFWDMVVSLPFMRFYVVVNGSIPSFTTLVMIDLGLHFLESKTKLSAMAL